MINVISGPKGTGKTKIILAEIDKALGAAKGDIVFITDKKNESIRVIDFNVRVLYTEDFGVACEKCFSGFVKGLMAGNSDIEYLFIDGLTRIIGNDMGDICAFLDQIIGLEKEYGFKVMMTVSKVKTEFPEIYAALVE
ncbi:MAG: hypothetical protein ILP02_01335 [Clostridia bacterium]|nr:hypothetical protein [Clostridia bacterium]